MKAIRRVSNSEKKSLYLTFDDGPDPLSTEAVLEVLHRHQARATFFVVSQKAEQQVQLLNKILKQGHSIGNHSLNHEYSVFFRGKKALRVWVETAEKSLQNLIHEPTIGFRPPAGVTTPELRAVLNDLEMPLLLWSTRFFDTTFAWSERWAMKSLKNARSGEIILLHDRQSMAKLPVFLRTLDLYITAAKEAGFEFMPLTQKLLKGTNHA